jgi:hypothetical protein
MIVEKPSTQGGVEDYSERGVVTASKGDSSSQARWTSSETRPVTRSVISQSIKELLSGLDQTSTRKKIASRHFKLKSVWSNGKYGTVRYPHNLLGHAA